MPRTNAGGRALAAAGGVFGAAGVALSAVAAHHGGANIGIAASFLLAHAPALLAIGIGSALVGGRPMKAGGFVILLGVVLFCSDLVMLDLWGTRPFPMAAPIGGTLTILGWLVVAAGVARGRPAA